MAGGVGVGAGGAVLDAGGVVEPETSRAGSAVVAVDTGNTVGGAVVTLLGAETGEGSRRTGTGAVALVEQGGTGTESAVAVVAVETVWRAGQTLPCCS